MNMEYYWELVLRDGTRYDIPPAGVAVVKKKMDQRDPITLKAAIVPYAEIKYFRQTNKPYGQNLLEAAAQAFREPLEGEDGATMAQWVKKPVTSREYSSHYSAIPAYKKIGTDGNMVMVAFRVPIHMVDTANTQPCSPEEIRKLT